MAWFVKQPVRVEAFRWTGDVDQTEDPEWIVEAIRDGAVTFSSVGTERVILLVHTLEGVMVARRGDWIIRGVLGEIYPCKPAAFEASYRPALGGPVRSEPITAGAGFPA